MRFNPVSVLLSLLGCAVQAQACESESTPIFACEAARGQKFIELCASTPLSAEGYLQYRFGALDESGSEKTVEFQFPSTRAGSLKHFFGATYTRQGLYTQSVRFSTGGFSYSVFTRARGSQTIEAGVEVLNQNSGRTSVVSCTERPRFYIFELKGLLACDPKTPAGTACIQ